ncbi:uncharacterized protein LODBEIA_P08380 [Lodderomyces beijingensis]|uniref:Uncharacterized protein n=1 Tax=Lodderomyces beijingensis TaxID=1775926 RepID=A0ABP0ZEM5_9ASCO
MLFGAFRSFGVLIYATQLLVAAASANEVINNVLYTHSGTKSQIILREIQEGAIPRQLNVGDVQDPLGFDLIVNLDAVQYFQNQLTEADSTKAEKLTDEQLISVAQRYLPRDKLDTFPSSIFRSALLSLTHWANEYVKYVYSNFLVRIIKYVYFWAYQVGYYSTKSAVKITGWYYGTSNLPVKCYIGVDWIDTDTRGTYLVGWETYTKSDNCAETVDQRSLEIILSQAKAIAAEHAEDANLCHHYENEAGVDSGAWFANIRILSVKEDAEMGENIWDIGCEAVRKRKRDTAYELLKNFAAIFT